MIAKDAFDGEELLRATPCHDADAIVVGGIVYSAFASRRRRPRPPFSSMPSSFSLSTASCAAMQHIAEMLMQFTARRASGFPYSSFSDVHLSGALVCRPPTTRPSATPVPASAAIVDATPLTMPAEMPNVHPRPVQESSMLMRTPDVDTAICFLPFCFFFFYAKTAPFFDAAAALMLFAQRCLMLSSMLAATRSTTRLLRYDVFTLNISMPC
jgi:hypothetical protein